MTTYSDRIQTLVDYGIDIPSLAINYARCIDFIYTIVSKHSCCLCEPETCLRCEAKVLLEELGEYEVCEKR